MITESMVYWITRLDGVLSVAGAMVVLALFGTLFTSAILLIGKCETRRGDDDDRRFSGILRTLIFAFVAMMLLSASVRLFVPSTKEMAAIKIIPAVASGKTIEELGSGAGRVVELLVKSLGEGERSSR